jgi:16S rRNA (adenine1518-N6/adenine1519-N6)-dimethyltransferase
MLKEREIKMQNILEETNFILKKYNIKANKSLGQNFLINQNVIDEIVNSADINKEDLVIEIGPGLGTLTKHLLEKAGKVICIELDERMVRIVNDRFSLYDNFEIINKDVLKVNLNEIIEKENKRCKIVANLPYYITTPIIMKLLESKLNIESITVMIQKEVADRLIAKPGEKLAGSITYTVYYYCESEKVLEVPNSSFIPEPEVTSEVIKMNLRKEPVVKVKDHKRMFAVIKAAFMQRRKTLLNSLTNGQIFSSKQKALEIFEKLDINQNSRAEELTLEKFAEITDYILEEGSK